MESGFFIFYTIRSFTQVRAIFNCSSMVIFELSSTSASSAFRKGLTSLLLSIDHINFDLIASHSRKLYSEIVSKTPKSNCQILGTDNVLAGFFSCCAIMTVVCCVLAT